VGFYLSAFAEYKSELATSITSNSNYIQPEQFGAKGDGIVDDTDSFIDMINKNQEEKKPILISKNYKISEDLVFNSSIEGKGSISTVSGAKIILKGNNLSVSGITINGNNTGMGLYVSYSSGCTIQDVSVLNVKGGGITLQTCDNSKVISCLTRNTMGKFGDGIIALNSRNIHIDSNVCSDFQRAGVVVDWSGEKKSENPIIVNNRCFDAYPSIDGQINAGIWIENCKNGKIENNTIRNTLSKGIVVTPNVNSKSTYEYFVSNNIVEYSSEGLNFVYASNQVLIESNNRYIDVDNVYEIGDCKKALLQGSTYLTKNKEDEQIKSIIRFKPSNSNTAELIIKDCENRINKDETPVSILNMYGIRGNITISDCIGNFRIAINENSLLGSIVIDNCELDYTKGRKTNYFSNNSGRFSVSNSKIILNPNTENRIQARMVEINNSNIISDIKYCKILVGQYGSRNFKIYNSTFENVYFSDITQPDTSINIESITVFDFPKIGFISSRTRIKEANVLNSTFYSSGKDAAINVKAAKNTLKNNSSKYLQ